MMMIKFRSCAVLLAVLNVLNVRGFLYTSQCSSTVCNQKLVLQATMVDKKINGRIGDMEEIIERAIRLSTSEQARTVMDVSNGGTLATASQLEGMEGVPFTSHADFVLNEEGWPVLFLAENSMHTQNIQASNTVSLFSRVPRVSPQVPAAALSRTTIIGDVERITDKDELLLLKNTYPLTHTFAERLVEVPAFAFYKIRPHKVYFVSGFGVTSKWVPVEDYLSAKPDILSIESRTIVAKINKERKEQLPLICQYFLGLEDVEEVSVVSADRLGIDLRIRRGSVSSDRTEEYRIGFRQEVASVEDAKSEVVKLFQEVWEREKGYLTPDFPPPLSVKYAEDILQKNKK